MVDSTLDVIPAIGEEPKTVPTITAEQWKAKLGIVPPEDIRNRIRLTRGMLGKDTLAYIGDSVWELLVLKHQYMQVVRSPYTESQIARTLKQAKAANMLFRSSLLTKLEKDLIEEGATNAWIRKATSNMKELEEVGYHQYSAALGLRTLLGWLYIDAKGDDSRLELIAKELGLYAKQYKEDELLSELTEGLFNPGVRHKEGMYFLALAPLGYVALRLYISRYLCQRPQIASEFIYRVMLALREEELDLASVGFMRDDATKRELELMEAARDQEDSFGFAFKCLLGYHAIYTPYRLHQIVASFGWAVPLNGTV